MNGRRYFHATGAALTIAAAALLAGCASTGDAGHTKHTAWAPAASAGTMMQMASLHGSQDRASPDVPPSAPFAAGADQRDSRVCRTVPPATGSRLGPRTMCMTGTQWDTKSRDDRDQLTDAESRALASSPYFAF